MAEIRINMMCIGNPIKLNIKRKTSWEEGFLSQMLFKKNQITVNPLSFMSTIAIPTPSSGPTPFPPQKGGHNEPRL
jgi:hypothetical protein